MKCANPMWVRQGGKTNRLQEIPCGKCVICLQNKQSVWTFRILNELEVAETARFVTLTYDEKYLPYINENGEIGTLWDENTKLWKEGGERIVNTLYNRDIQLFLKKTRSKIMREYRNTFKGSKIEELKEGIRWVKKNEISGKWSPKLRYYGCGEYGDKGERAHWHIIMFNIPREWIKWDPIHEEEYSPKLEQIWGKGIISVSEVNRKRAAYCAGYMMKQVGRWWDDEKEIRVKPYQIMSKNPGIGANYINDENRNYHLSTKNNYTRLEGGYKQSLGTYYKKKIWGENKKNWEYEYEAEEGNKVTGETPGIRLRSKEETMALRKSRFKALQEKRAREATVLGEELGDIHRSDKRIRDEERERIETIATRTMNKKTKL